MRKVTIHQVDAFTTEVFGGNPAAVVTDASNLTDKDMQNIAREMNLSETAFVHDTAQPEADMRIRYFTPETEVKFCGHATIASLCVLALNKLYGLHAPGRNAVRIETAAGLLDMSVTNTQSGSEMGFAVPEPALQEYNLQGKQFSDMFGIDDIVDPTAKIFVEEKPQKFVFVPVATLDALREIRYDTQLVKERFGTTGTIIFCFYSDETMATDSDLHARSFGPLIGLDEDPFTGAVQAGLVLAAKRNTYIAPEQARIITEQGHVMGRPGTAKITHDIQNNTVNISAHAVKVFTADMEF